MVDNEGRITVDLKPVYQIPEPLSVIKPKYDIFTIIPLFDHRDASGNTLLPSNIVTQLKFAPLRNPADIDNMDYQYKFYYDACQNIYTHGYVLINIPSRDYLLKIFFLDEYTNATFTDVEKVLNIRKNLPLYVLWELLDVMSVNCLFVMMYSPFASYPTPPDIIIDFDTNSNFLIDMDIFVELGLRFSDYTPLYYDSTVGTGPYIVDGRTNAVSVLQTLFTINNQRFVMSVDTDITLNIGEADNQNSVTFTGTDDQKASVVSNYGWILTPKSQVMPPTYVYTLNVYNNALRNAKFASIVNKKYKNLLGSKSIVYALRETVNSYLQSVINGAVSTNMIIIKDGYPIFLTEVTMNAQKNAFRFESAVRASYFAAKVIRETVSRVIGRRFHKFNFTEFEKNVNQLLSVRNPDLNMTFFITATNEQKNEVYCGLNVYVNAYTYTINLEVTVTD